MLSVFDGVPTFEVARDEIIGCKAVDLLAEKTSCLPSKSECRKLAKGGGLSINKEKVADIELALGTDDLLDGKYLLVQKGKKNYFLIIAR